MFIKRLIPFGGKKSSIQNTIASNILNNYNASVGNLANTRVNLKGDKFYFYLFIFSLIFVGFSSIIIVLNWAKIPPEVPVFYSRPWGNQVIGNKFFVWIIPAIALGTSGLNVFLFSNFSNNIFLRRVLITFGFLISAMCFWDIYKIIVLVA